ncbi:MAG: hypothetical protein WAV73_03740 [Candidatus Moraniibacteriota bacterium]
MKNKQNFSKIFLVIFLSLAFFGTAFFVSDAEAANLRPADYVNLHELYTRAPTDWKILDDEGNWTGEYSQYWSFAIPDTEIGYLPYIRAFIPPGMITLDLRIIEGGQQTAVARHKFPPAGEPTAPPAGYFPVNGFTLQELMAQDQWATESLQGYLDIAQGGSNPPLSISDAGWLYAKIGGGADSRIYFTSFAVKVDIATYNAWWDTYIKDAAGWERYVESVETYIDPTTTTPTPVTPAVGANCAQNTCLNVSCDSQNGSANPWIYGTKTIGCATVAAGASPNSITPISETPPSEIAYLTWSATDARKLEVECTGVTTIPRSDFPLNSDLWEADAARSGLYIKPANAPSGYPGWFHVGTSGTERCTFFPTNQSDGLSGTPFTVEIEVEEPDDVIPIIPPPADCVTLHAPYTRAPDNVEYYSFTHSQANYHGYIPYYRVFIPPGTVALDLQHTAMGSLMGLARHKFPPAGLPDSYGDSSYPTLSELEAGEQRATFSDSYDLLQMVSDGFTPPLSIGRAGWLYAKIASDGQYTFFDNHFSVRVDTATYNAWWDNYGSNSDGSINWERDVESMTTYVARSARSSLLIEPSCAPSCACASEVLIGSTCADGCGGICRGTKGSCHPDNPACAMNTCKEVYCFDGCERQRGTKDCNEN